MPDQIDLDDPRYGAAAAEMLRRHDNYEAEANITSAIRDFLIVTGLAKSDEIDEEVSPATGSIKAVDLTALNAFIEVKRRIGSTAGFDPNPEYVRQLDGYLAQAETDGRMFRMGVLTDGRHWLLRWPGAGPVRTAPPHGFVLENPDRWFLLYEWLREKALFTERRIRPDRENVGAYFGPDSPLYEREITAFRSLYDSVSDRETLVPYATLNPLKALLPIKQDVNTIPADPDGVGGVRLGGLERRMRERWRTVSGLWEENKSSNNRLDLLGQLDYYGKLTAQLE